MRYSLAIAAALAGVVSANPIAEPQATATGAASTCSGTYSGTFEIEVVNVTSSKRDIQKRAALELTLSNGVLKDAQGRIGYIASNRQFQFDYEAQPGSVYASGWAVCSNNNTLVLGKDAVFQQCLSGTFYNLYDENSAAQCSPVYIDVVSSGGAAASQLGDGQVTASAVASVSQISDGQPQVATSAVAPITQITDGQIQAPTKTSAVAPVTQITDGQIQAPTKTSAVAPVTQITDGQIQAPTSKVSAQPTLPTNGTIPQRPSASVQAYTGAAALPTAQAFIGLAAAGLAIAML